MNDFDSLETATGEASKVITPQVQCYILGTRTLDRARKPPLHITNTDGGAPMRYPSGPCTVSPAVNRTASIDHRKVHHPKRLLSIASKNS